MKWGDGKGSGSTKAMTFDEWQLATLLGFQVFILLLFLLPPGPLLISSSVLSLNVPSAQGPLPSFLSLCILSLGNGIHCLHLKYRPCGRRLQLHVPPTSLR